MTGLSFEERILAIEAALPYQKIPGTGLNRVMHPESGVQWCLGLGGLQLPLTFFYGRTIEEVLAKGEAEIEKMKESGAERLKTGMDLLFADIDTAGPSQS